MEGGRDRQAPIQPSARGNSRITCKNHFARKAGGSGRVGHRTGARGGKTQSNGGEGSGDQRKCQIGGRNHDVAGGGSGRRGPIGDSVRCSKQQVKGMPVAAREAGSAASMERERTLLRRAGRKKARVDQA